MTGAGVTPAQAAAFERCVAQGGVAVFPADTVYGLACDPSSPDAVERLYRLKRRSSARAAAVMFFSLEAALAALDGLGARSRDALRRPLPGALTLLLPNPKRLYPLACGDEPGRVGLRVPALEPPVAALGALARPVLQSSANLSGGEDPRTLVQVDPEIRRDADLALDGGPLPGTPSTVVDLTRYEDTGALAIRREGAVSGRRVEELLAPEA